MKTARKKQTAPPESTPCHISFSIQISSTRSARSRSGRLSEKTLLQPQRERRPRSRSQSAHFPRPAETTLQRGGQRSSKDANRGCELLTTGPAPLSKAAISQSQQGRRRPLIEQPNSQQCNRCHRTRPAAREAPRGHSRTRQSCERAR